MRCLIVDDNASFLAAARSLLERQGMVVVGLASNGARGVERAVELRPDVILIDIDLGAESGFSVALDLVASAGASGPAIILISTHPQDDFAELVDRSPALGFIAKSELSAQAIEALLDDRRGLPSETLGK